MKKENNSIYTFDGLDATGKSTILKMFQEKNINVVTSPPDWMTSNRQNFDDGDLKSRFLYYLFGNNWIDKQILKPSLIKKELILIDRSILSTLAAHELRGLPEEYLKVGFDLAKTFVKPEACYIIHVDKEERLQRLLKRSHIDNIDRQNLAFENSMEITYKKWADRLDWNIVTFDNSRFTPKEAVDKLSELILRK